MTTTHTTDTTITVTAHGYTATLDLDTQVVEIYDALGHWAGTGRWDGHTIADCPAVLGGDQDTADEIYESLDAAMLAEWPSALQRSLRAGDRLAAGQGADRDTGIVRAVEGGDVEIGWDSGVITTQPISALEALEVLDRSEVSR